MESVTLTIDGREVEVEPGTTILEAARRLGIEIPTLCHVAGLPPAASCFLCCVQVEGMRTLSPSCALPAAAGMTVETASDDVRASRKMALELLLSDHAGDCVAPCAARCPAGLDIPGFVYEIAAGDSRRSMEVISGTLSLPGTLGRICPRLCEEQCRRCDHDESLAIAALHRYSADRNREITRPYEPTPGRPTGKSVGIVGAGPAGLTAAFYLLQDGHACTLYEAHSQAGGMLRYGIPDYRLPPAALDAEIEVIERLGAEMRMNVRWGRDFSLADLRETHDAVFLGIGAQLSKGLRCAGEELALSGIELLERTAVGEPPDLGARVIVLGGGNTAMDAARTAVRLVNGRPEKDVRVLYRRTRHEMPCLLEEVEGAEEEGVAIDYLVAPVYLARLDNGQGRLELTCQRMELGEPDASGRRRPVPIAGSEFTLACDTVVAAVGQGVEIGLAESEGLEVTAWGLAADGRTLATNLPGVFAGGDAVLGADLAVRAVASGRLAAAAIGQYLGGEPLVGIGVLGSSDIAMRPVDEGEMAEIFRGIEKSLKVESATLGLDGRQAGFGEIELGLSAEEADRESRRCLSCGCRAADGCSVRRWSTEYGVDPYRFAGERRRFEQDLSHPEIIYEPGKCIMCGACVEVTSESGEVLGLEIVGRGFEVSVQVPFDEPLSEGLKRAARRCAEVCPTGALALRTARSCDLGGCGAGLQPEPQLVTLGRRL